MLCFLSDTLSHLQGGVLLKNIESEKENLAKIMQGIARHFGDNCEVVLHDFAKDPDHTILAIENGHVTNRRAGGPITSHGLEIIRGVKTPTDQFNYQPIPKRQALALDFHISL